MSAGGRTLRSLALIAAIIWGVIAGSAPLGAAEPHAGQLQFAHDGTVRQFDTERDAYVTLIDGIERRGDPSSLVPWLDYVSSYLGRSTTPRPPPVESGAKTDSAKDILPMPALLARSHGRLFVYNANEDYELHSSYSMGRQRPQPGESSSRVFAREDVLYAVAHRTGGFDEILIIDGAGGMRTISPRGDDEASPGTEEGIALPKGTILGIDAIRGDGHHYVAAAMGERGLYLADLSAGRSTVLEFGQGNTIGDVALSDDGFVFLVSRDATRRTSVLAGNAAELVAGDRGGEYLTEFWRAKPAAERGDTLAVGVIDEIRSVGMWQEGVLARAEGLTWLVRPDEKPRLVFGNGKSQSLQLSPVGILRNDPAATGAISGWSPSDKLVNDRIVAPQREFSVGTWLYLHADQTPYTVVIDNRHSGNSGWVLGVSNTRIYSYRGHPFRSSTSSTKAQPRDRWLHVVAVFSARAQEVYVNGVRVSRTEGLPVVGKQGLSVGGRVDPRDPRALKPSTALARIFLSDRALSPASIRDLYQRERLKLDEGDAHRDRLDFGGSRWDWGNLPEFGNVGLPGRVRAFLTRELLPDVSRTVTNPSLLGFGTGSLLLLLAVLAARSTSGATSRIPTEWVIVLGGIAISFIAYSGNLSHPIRSDNFIAYNLFAHLSYGWEDLMKAARFEMFGHRRVHPIAHLIMFFQYKIFGLEHVWHHLFQFVLHTANVILVFIVAHRLCGNRIAAAVSAFLFATAYSHFDMINWTYHSFVVIDCSLVLLSYLCIIHHVERNRPAFLVLALILLFIAQLIYEANALLSASAFGVLFLLTWRKLGRIDLRDRGLVTFAGGFAAIYLAYLGIFVHETSLTALENPDIEGQIRFLTLLDPNILKGALRTMVQFLWDPLLLKFFGFPSGLDVRDIVYLYSVRPSQGYLVYMGALVAMVVVLSALRVRRQDVLLLLLMLGTLLSFVFIVALGRSVSAPEGYVLSQSHYIYFPNLMVVLMLAMLLTREARLDLRFGRLLLATVMLVGVFNASRIYDHTREVTEVLAESRSLLETVDGFIDEHPSSDPPRLFVNFPTIQNNYTLNLGADIMLDVYYRDSNIITRNACEAEFVLDKEHRIMPNDLCDGSEGRYDFTVEFVAQLHAAQFPKEFSFVGWLDGPWAIGFDRDGQLFYQSRELSTGKLKRIAVDHDFTVAASHHVVVQRSGDRLFFVVDGRVEKIADVPNLDMAFTDDPKRLLGDFYVGARVVAYSTGLHVTFGATRYDLEGIARGDVIPTKWMEPWISVPIDYYG